MGDPTAQHAAAPVQGRLATRSERGASAVEYGLLIAGIAAIIVIAVFAFGGGVKGLFSQTCGTVAAATSQSSC